MHTSALIQYLQGLAENNNKAWFVMNKPSYDILREEFVALVAEVIKGIAKFDPLIAGVDAKKALFRINRDMRFSKDKSPYKTTFSAAISNGDKKGSVPMYYFHIDAKGTLLIAGGCYLPEKEVLAAIRAGIAAEPKELSKLIRNKKLMAGFGGLDKSDALARPPKGYAPDTPMIEYIKLKNFIAVTEVDLNQRMPKSLSTEIVKTFSDLHPLIVWLRSCLKSKGANENSN